MTKKTEAPKGEHLTALKKQPQLFEDFNAVLKKHGLNNLDVSSFHLKDKIADASGCHLVCENTPAGHKCWTECD